MSKLAYIFPGQGSQYVGMGEEIAENQHQAKQVFATADSALGFSLSTLCFQGPEEELKITYNTQPAILTTSMALYEVFKEKAPKADYVAGHSLGEYSALVAAGALAFADAVKLVHKRGQFMDDAVPSGLGAMAAVMGAERELIGNVCEEITLDGDAVQMANINCPGQIVISGTKDGVERASLELKNRGVKRVIPLVVSGPFHSDLMKPAASRLARVLEEVKVSTASIPVVVNTEARPVMLGEDLEQALIEQVFSPVLWQDCIEWMLGQHVDTFVEIGPGQVLSGLVKKIAKEKGREVSIYSVSDEASMEKTWEALQEK